MMQALLQTALGEGYVVESAGVRREAAGLSADPRAIACMADRGFDLTGHCSRWAGDINLTEYSHIFCVDDLIAQRVSELLPTEAKANVTVPNAGAGGIPDPSKGGLPAYRACLALLDQIVPQAASQITVDTGTEK